MDFTNSKTKYLSVKRMSELTGISERVIQKRCARKQYKVRKLHSNCGKGGLLYEILVSSLPEDLQKKVYENIQPSPEFLNSQSSLRNSTLSRTTGEGVTKSPLEIGVNAGGYQFAETQKETDVPTAVQATAQGSLNNKTGGVYPDSISGFILNSNNAGFSLKSNALTPTAQPPLTLGGNADCNASPHPNPLPEGEGGMAAVPENDEKTNVIIETNLQESCALTEEQAQTLISFGLLSKEKEVKSATEIQKKKALAWVDLLALWHEYRNNKSAQEWSVESEEWADKSAFIPEFNEKCGGDLLKKDKSADMARVDSEFVELFNGGVIYPELYKQIGKISRPTLYRKAKIYKENKKDFYALIPDYGTNNKFRSKLSLIERYYLLKIMLHQNCYTLGRAYEIINRILAKEGIKICSYSAYKRAWDYVMKNDYARVMFARGGLKVYKDKAAPYIMRKNNVLGFGDELIGDGHTLDFMVRNPFNGKPCRAALIGFLDSASGDLAGYDIMLTENTQVIASALRNAIIYMGKYPKVVHLDNGRAFKSKYFTQTASLKTTNIQGLYAKLNIETLFSKAYNGRAKTIERFFKEFTESEAKTWASYIGNCVDNKPAHVKRNEKFHRY